MSKTVFAVFLTAVLTGGAALAQDGKGQQSIEARLERIEQAVARLDQKLSARGSGAMMAGCPMMDGVMGGGEGRGDRSPNKQWQEAPAK